MMNFQYSHMRNQDLRPRRIVHKQFDKNCEKKTTKLRKGDSKTQHRQSFRGRSRGDLNEGRIVIRESLYHHVYENLVIKNRLTYYQRIYVFATILTDINTLKNETYQKYFIRNLQNILTFCEKQKCSPDHLTGLILFMETHMFLLIEGSEDIVNCFFDSLVPLETQLWSDACIFFVENNTDETYFPRLIICNTIAMNINKKFPPATINDANLMVMEHFKIKEKIKKLIEIFSIEISTSEKSKEPDNLSQEKYNKLLPEIQYIDLILSAKKFYLNIRQFNETYNYIPANQDDAVIYWPIYSNYTPSNIYERSPFDVNLTFGDYNQIHKFLEDEEGEEDGEEEEEDEE